jgi:cold-inducible RNA-binding protein
MKRLFVGNMSFQSTESDLMTLFQAYGQIGRIQVVTDRETGRSRGFAFVEMPNDAEAANAIAGLNGKEIGGRNLNVNEARPKTDGGHRSSGSKGYGGDRGRSGRGGSREPRW